MTVERKVTLRDIAEQCAVSPTLVSAVINGRHGRISCSTDKRAQILKTAKALNYQVNIFARTMKLKRVPIVGVMLHCDLHPQVEMSIPSLFVETAHTQLTLTFNRNELEVLFIPYFSEEEQLARLNKLHGYGLIGGVVTNIIPENHHRICRYLADSGLPYMVLGNPMESGIYCTYPISSVLDAKIMDIAAQQGRRRAIQVIVNTEKIEFRRYPFPDGYMWTAPVLSQEEIDPAANDTLYAIHGVTALNELTRQHIELKHRLIVESEQLKHLANPAEYDLLLVSSHYIFGRETDYVVRSLVRWMKHGAAPEQFSQRFDDADTSIIKYFPHP